MILKKKQHASTASLLGVILTFGALLVAWGSPLLSTPTVEAALFLGMFLAPVSFMAGVSRGANRNPAGFGIDVLKELSWIGMPAVFYLGVLLIHSWTVESCSSSSGVFPFIIILFPQILLCVVSGIALGRLVGNPKLANILGLLIIPIYLLVQSVFWWLSPSMRFFDLYWFFVGGDLLGGQALEPAVITYRLAALFYALAIVTMGLNWKKHATKFWIMVALLLSAVGLHSHSYAILSPNLTARKADYPDTMRAGPFILHTSIAAIGRENAEAVLQEAELWLGRLKARTGLSLSKDVHIWLYESSASLAKYTGAKHVHFTLPSHREIHISSVEIPHPTLGHEIAHVILGEVSTTIWGVPGIWGVLPNWGLSEGLATYLTPELSIRDNLTLKEQAVSLYRLGLESDPAALLDNDPWSFWLQSSSRAYATSAALIEDFIGRQCRTDNCRSRAIVKLARGGEIYLSNSQLNTIIADWKQFSLPSDALGVVSEDFASNSILRAECKNGSEIKIFKKKESPEDKADEFALAGDFLKASNLYDQISVPEQSVPKQRELTIKKSLLSDAAYARAALDIIVRKPRTPLEAGAAYGKLGLSLVQKSDADLGYLYSNYLLGRAQILSGDFASGEKLMPQTLEGPVGLEAMRLYALSRAETGYPVEAASIYQALRERSLRLADRLLFADYAERALGIAAGQKYLLGVWTKVK